MYLQVVLLGSVGKGDEYRSVRMNSVGAATVVGIVK